MMKFCYLQLLFGILTVCLLSRCTTEVTANASAYLSCKACNEAGYRWCANVIITSIGDRVEDKSYWPGICLSEGEICAAQRFGQMEAAPNAQQRTLTLDREILQEFHSDCSDVDFPRSVATETCEKCVDSGEDNVWCKTKVKTSAGDVSLRTSYCIPRYLSHFCQSRLLHQVAIGYPDVEMFSQLFNLDYSQTAAQCTAPIAPQPAPTPDNTCSNNLDCQTCGNANSCTWCSAQVTHYDEKQNPVFNMMGVCVDGADNDCSDVKLGTIPGTGRLTYDTEAAKSLVLSVKTVALSTSDPSGACGLAQWPRYYFAKNVEECHQSCMAGWCDLTIGDLSLGMCMPDILRPICDSPKLIAFLTNDELPPRPRTVDDMISGGQGLKTARVQDGNEGAGDELMSDDKMILQQLERIKEQLVKEKEKLEKKKLKNKKHLANGTEQLEEETSAVQRSMASPLSRNLEVTVANWIANTAPCAQLAGDARGVITSSAATIVIGVVSMLMYLY